MTSEGRRRLHGELPAGLPSELSLITLYDPRTGVPRAIVDATEITERGRARSPPSARGSCPARLQVLGHIGARGTAFSNVHARPLLRLRGDTSDEQAARVAHELRRLEDALGKPVRVVETIEEAVVGADIVVEATRLAEPAPLLRTAWLDACTLLVPYGTKSILELDVLDAMDKVVVDDWAQCKRDDPFGALRPHVRAGLLSEATLHAELAEVVVGTKPGRERDDERILFWHRGLATTDLALADLLVRRASSGAGRGSRTDDRADRSPRRSRSRPLSPRRRRHEQVEVAEALYEHVDERRAALLDLVADGAAVYGVTTGLGYL